MQKVNMADEVIDLFKLCDVTQEQIVEIGVDDLVEWMYDTQNMLSGFILGKYRDINVIPDDKTFDDIAKDVIAKLIEVV